MNRRKPTAKPAPPAWRNRTLLAAFALAAVALEVRLAWLQLVDGEFLTEQGEQRQLRTVDMPVYRARIVDRNGEPLAVSTPVDSIAVNPQEFPPDRDRIFELAAATGEDAEAVERSITTRPDREFVWIKRHLSPASAAAVMQLGIDGVEKRREYRRYYPMHEATCQLVGYTDIDDKGIEGLESIYDDRLTGTPGAKTVRRDETGRTIADVEQIRAPVPGREVRLSIDARLQYAAYRALKRAVRDNDANWGSIVILDAQNGELLALVNEPSCNPNDRSQRDPAPSRNRAITDPIEPGSTIKPLIMAAALANGYTPEQRIDVPRDLYIDGKRITSDPRTYGHISLTEILAHSSNVGTATIALELEPAELWQTLRDFGLAQGTTERGLLAKREATGTLNRSSLWSKTDHATISYGYTLSVTPLQLARAYTAIAGGGLMPFVSFEPLDAAPERQRVMSPEVADDLMGMLEAVVDREGTALRASIDNYRVAGKTGTARISTPGGYADDRYRAIFAGIVPASAPRFVAVVVIEEPRGPEYHGGDVAAPVFAEVIGTALRLYGVAPDALDAPTATLLSRAEVAR
jgi:cell division protein FtsI (penicillin-binding protein 3)